MHALSLYKTEKVDKLAWPVTPNKVTLQSSALNIFTDFKQHMPLVIDYKTRAIVLERLMKRSHVKMKLVLGPDGEFMGIVTLHDLDEQNIMQKVAQGTPRNELTAEDFLQPKTALRSFDFDELARSSVGDIVETLKDNGHQHCLVIDRTNHEIRGVVSVSDIARILRLPMDIQVRPTFSQLSKVIAA